MDKEKVSNFCLSKWYMDLTCNNGTALICYSAKMNWKNFSFNYSSLIYKESSQAVNKTSWRRQPAPADDGKNISWNIPSFNFSGKWCKNALPIYKELYNNEKGYIKWDCLAPKCNAEVNWNNKILTGTGYVEKLDMTLKPWELPFNELRWGRFISNNNYSVWIEWNGEIKKELLLFNGFEQNNCTISDDTISCKNNTIELDRQITLRSGEISSTVFNKVPKGILSIPGKLLSMQESKWISCGTIKTENHLEKGWAIHEIVKFK